jgi:hypothetical protein
VRHNCRLGCVLELRIALDRALSPALVAIVPDQALSRVLVGIVLARALSPAPVGIVPVRELPTARAVRMLGISLASAEGLRPAIDPASVPPTGLELAIGPVRETFRV